MIRNLESYVNSGARQCEACASKGPSLSMSFFHPDSSTQPKKVQSSPRRRDAVLLSGSLPGELPNMLKRSKKCLKSPHSRFLNAGPTLAPTSKIITQRPASTNQLLIFAVNCGGLLACRNCWTVEIKGFPPNGRAKPGCSIWRTSANRTGLALQDLSCRMFYIFDKL